MNTSSATGALDDPYYPCTVSKGFKSVWYAYTPATDGVVTITTLGSAFDTVLGIWQGTRGNLTNLACNDDYSGTTSRVSLALSAGQTYLIEVAGYYTYSSGFMQLNFHQSENATVTPTPSITPTATQTLTPHPDADEYIHLHGHENGNQNIDTDPDGDQYTDHRSCQSRHI